MVMTIYYNVLVLKVEIKGKRFDKISKSLNPNIFNKQVIKRKLFTSTVFKLLFRLIPLGISLQCNNSHWEQLEQQFKYNVVV